MLEFGQDLRQESRTLEFFQVLNHASSNLPVGNFLQLNVEVIAELGSRLIKKLRQAS